MRGGHGAGKHSHGGALWMRLDSRLRGNDAVWCREGFSVAHEPSCFNVTGCEWTALKKLLFSGLPVGEPVLPSPSCAVGWAKPQDKPPAHALSRR